MATYFLFIFILQFSHLFYLFPPLFAPYLLDNMPRACDLPIVTYSLTPYVAIDMSSYC